MIKKTLDLLASFGERINSILDKHNELRDKKFDELINAMIAVYTDLCELNTLLYQIMNNINTPYNITQFKNTRDIMDYCAEYYNTLYICLSTFKTEYDILHCRKKVTQKQIHFLELYDQCISTIKFLNTYSKVVSDNMNNFDFSSMESFAYTMYHMNKCNCDYINKKLTDFDL